MSKLAVVFAFLLFVSLPGASIPGSTAVYGPKVSVSVLSTSLMAQEPSAEHEAGAGEHAAQSAEHGEENEGLHEAFHYFNFAVLAFGIFWLVKKMLVPFLNERGRLIREDMQKSAEAIEQANARLKAMEDRMNNLDTELASMREAGLNEARAERARIEKEAENEATKILAAANMEMDSAVKAARQELQTFASQLALDVAEKKIKVSLTPQSEKKILNSFIDRLASASDGDGRKN
jgi:F-type H+-transporting ATPase subunit b